MRNCTKFQLFHCYACKKQLEIIINLRSVDDVVRLKANDSQQQHKTINAKFIFKNKSIEERAVNTLIDRCKLN